MQGDSNSKYIRMNLSSSVGMKVVEKANERKPNCLMIYENPEVFLYKVNIYAYFSPVLGLIYYCKKV